MDKENKKESREKCGKKKKCYFSIGTKISFIFFALSISLLMSGFIVSTKVSLQEATFWKAVANYYYEDSQEDEQITNEDLDEPLEEVESEQEANLENSN